MSLASRCPHCGTAFRVVSDQLKLRRGLVRCGKCRQVFNGFDHLLYVSARGEALASATGELPRPAFATEAAASQLASPAARPAAPVPAPRAPQPAPDYDPDNPQTIIEIIGELSEPVEAGQFREESPPSVWPEPREAVSAPEPSAMPETAAVLSVPSAEAELASVEAVEAAPAIEPLEEADEAEGIEESALPAFLQSDRTARRARWRWAALAIVLGIVLGGQILVAQRSEVAAMLPSLRPLLSAACQPLGCEVGYPRRIEEITIASSELQPIGASKDQLLMVVALRNHASTELQWPGIELTLTDVQDRPVARRVFLPADYLASTIADRNSAQPGPAGLALASNAEPLVRLGVDVAALNARGRSAAGYRVAIFYP